MAIVALICYFVETFFILSAMENSHMKDVKREGGRKRREPTAPSGAATSSPDPADRTRKRTARSR